MSSSSSSSSILFAFLILFPSFFFFHLHAFGDGVVESAESTSSLLFIETPTHPYLRTTTTTTTTTTTQDNLMSLNEVVAAVSILLGLPPPTLSTSTSTKLNQLLMPNPFHRPHHVLMLEVALPKGSLATMYPNAAAAAVSDSAITRKVITTSTTAHIQLPDTEEVVLFPLYGSDYDAHKYMTHQEISDFAQSFGGSYVSSNLEALNGELIIPLPSGLQINLHMSKKADREFATALIYMLKKIKVIGMAHDNVAELVQGYFDGLKGLAEEYGSKDVTPQAMELLVASISKVFESLHAQHKGEIVAVILLKEVESRMIDVTFDARPSSSRLLGEVNTTNATTSNSIIIAQIVLVRTTIAWVTGILLLIATIIGLVLLLNMPLTRDTLLYSNVKLD